MPDIYRIVLRERPAPPVKAHYDDVQEAIAALVGLREAARQDRASGISPEQYVLVRVNDDDPINVTTSDVSVDVVQTE